MGKSIFMQTNKLVVIEQVLGQEHPFYAKDGVWYRVKNIQTGQVSLAAYTTQNAADKALERLQAGIGG